jgi:hypothetical protein
MMKQRAAALCCVGVFFVASATARAQQDTDAPAAVVEVWGSASGVIAGPSAEAVSAYSPPLLFDGAFTSRGGQTLAAHARRAVGVSGGVNIFPRNRFGLQVLVDRATCEVSAANSPYTIALEYVSRPPPSGEAQVVSISRLIAWPSTSGSVTEWAFAFNAVARIGRSDRVSMLLSAGPTYYRLTGELQPLGFTTFQLGGHSVLFENDYRLAASVGRAHALGFDAGTELNAALGRHAAIIAGYRYLGARRADVLVQPTRIVNPTELIQPASMADIASRLGPVPTRVAMSGSRVFVGLKLRR